MGRFQRSPFWKPPRQPCPPLHYPTRALWSRVAPEDDVVRVGRRFGFDRLLPRSLESLSFVPPPAMVIAVAQSCGGEEVQLSGAFL